MSKIKPVKAWGIVSGGVLLGATCATKEGLTRRILTDYFVTIPDWWKLVPVEIRPLPRKKRGR